MDGRLVYKLTGSRRGWALGLEDERNAPSQLASLTLDGRSYTGSDCGEPPSTSDCTLTTLPNHPTKYIQIPMLRTLRTLI